MEAPLPEALVVARPWAAGGVPVDRRPTLRALELVQRPEVEGAHGPPSWRAPQPRPRTVPISVRMGQPPPRCLCEASGGGCGPRVEAQGRGKPDSLIAWLTTPCQGE